MFKTRTAILLLVLAWLILCWPWLLNKRTVPFDSKDQFYPFLYFVSQSLRGAELPLWNPHIYSGYPMVSDPQSMLFSPIAVGLMSIVDKPSLHWFDAIELLHLLLGGLGMLFASIQLGRSGLAGLFAAVVYMFGGSISGRMQHVPIIYAYAYFPFALLALDRFLKSNRVAWACCFGLTAGILAAHQNQVAYLLTLVLFGYLLDRAMASGSIRLFVVARWPALAVAVGIGAITLAIPVYSTLQLLPLSNRPYFPYDVAVQNALHPVSFITLFVRNFFDNAHPLSYWGYGDVTTTFLYAGTLPTILVLRYGLMTGALFDRQFRYFYVVGIAAALYVVGDSTPFYWFAYHFLPGVALYRRPSDATFVVNMVEALATGFLMDRLLEGSPSRVRSFGTLLGLTILAMLLGRGLLDAQLSGKLDGMNRDLALAALFTGVALWLLQAVNAAPTFRKRIALTFVGLVLLTADFSAHNSGTQLNAVGPESYPLLQDMSSPQTALPRFLNAELNAAGEGGPYRAEIVHAGAELANAPMIFGIQSTQGYNPIRYSLYDRVVGSAPSYLEQRAFTPMVPSYNSPLLNILGVKLIVSDKTLTELDPRVDESRFTLVSGDSKPHVWRNDNAFPRILAVDSVYIESNLEEAIALGRWAPVGFRSVVVLPHLPASLSSLQPPFDEVRRLPGQGASTVLIREYGNTRIVASVETEKDVIVVLNDTYYPYWRVYVDDHEMELLQANYLFRGVHVMPGNHRIVFSFEPFSWMAFKRTVKGVLEWD